MKMSKLVETFRSKAFGGLVKRFEHESTSTKCRMKFHVFLPPQAAERKCATLYILSGLTCDDTNFVTKVGAQRAAAAHGLILVMPDTSPREGTQGEEDHPLLGTGAGYYVDATQAPWAEHYQMFSYVTGELIELVEAELPALPAVRSIMGHSMGGHGALVAFLRAEPGSYRSVSALAPVGNPSKVEGAPAWKALSAYLGEDRSQWHAYDSSELIRAYRGPPISILVDQGETDPKRKLLASEELVEAASSNSAVSLNYRLQPGYDHELAFFVATFIDEHIAYHARHL
uniref:S-formylglutathione hydrolase n=1 Tax=Coccolithus braarudii TaxID=221442 RepID=A0A7S0KZX1_9EUKA